MNIFIYIIRSTAIAVAHGLLVIIGHWGCLIYVYIHSMEYCGYSIIILFSGVGVLIFVEMKCGKLYVSLTQRARRSW
jgi:hypothetical protein